METYASLVANGPQFNWYRDQPELSSVRSLFQEWDLQVWADRYFTGQGWQQIDKDRRHQSYQRSEVHKSTHRLLKKAWPGSEAIVSCEVKCYHYSIDSVIEFRNRQKTDIH